MSPEISERAFEQAIERRGFCRVCGSPLLSRFDFDPTVYGLPLGALDDDPGRKPKLHVFVAHKAPWYDITDELPQFAELPPKASR